jgi:HEAT repeat protein
MAMGAVRELEGAIVPLVDDEDHVIRAEAARALGQCDTPTARAALDAALGDRSVIVQETAAHSLELLDAAAARQRKLDRQEKPS